MIDNCRCHAFLEFFAYWCASSRIRAHFLQELAREYEGKVSFFQVCIEQSPLTAARFQITTLPDSILLYNGHLYGRLTGAFSKGLLKKRIDNYLGHH
jgi:thioredoxin 1